MCSEDAFWRVGFVLMASMLAGLYTEGGVYIKGGYTVRPVYKFSKWGPLHVVWVYEDFRGRGRGGAAQTNQSLALSPDSLRWTDNIISCWYKTVSEPRSIQTSKQGCVHAMTS